MKNKNIKRCFAKNVGLLYTTGLESNAGKEFLNLSKNEQITLFCDEIAKETEKPLEEIDSEKMDFYTELLDVISGSPEGALNDEGLNTLFCEITEEHKKKTAKSKSKAKGFTAKRKTWKHIAVAAAIIVSLFCAATVAGAINGVNVFDEVYKWGRSIFNLKPGVEYNEDNITVIRNDNVKTYNGFNKMLSDEKLPVLSYPEYLPKGIELEKVLILDEKSNITVIFNFNDEDFLFSAVSTDLYGLEKDIYKKYVSDKGVQIHYLEKEKNQLMWTDGMWFYLILTSNFDEAVKVIDSMTAIN